MPQNCLPSEVPSMRNYPDEKMANPPGGEKVSFRPLTVMLHPGTYKKLIQESARRKMEKEPNQLLSAMVREAVAEYLKQIEHSL